MPQTFPNPPAQLTVPRRLSTAGRRLDAAVLLRLWHLSSLDAPTVAVVWSLAFAWAAQVRLPAWIPVLLALAAWAVYIADRLLDARTALRSANLQSLRERHSFHHRHRRVLVPVAVAAACAAAGIVFTLMPLVARERNSVLAVAALAYFTRVHSPARSPGFRGACLFPLLTKEFLVGMLFTAACALPVLARLPAQEPLWPIVEDAVFFALLAWLNCHAIDRWEAEESEYAEWDVLAPAFLLALAGLALAGAFSAAQPRMAALATAGSVSALLLALLDRNRGRLTPLALRVAADLVLLAPLALLLG